MEPDIVFIGAGPVGLFTAINTKLTNPNQHILLLERNNSYSRSHFLKIDGDSYRGAHPNEAFQEILRGLQGRVLTTDIEHTLKNFALSIGIEIKHDKVEDVPGVTSLYPSAHTIVGSDGAHSVVRAQIFDDDKEIDKNLQYIIEVKYKVSGATAALSYVETASGLTQIPHFVSENVGNTKVDKEGKLSTPVSLFFFVDKETYEQVRAKKRGSLSLDELDSDTTEMAELANSIFPWLKYREIIKGEQAEACKISAVALNNYCSSSCVTLIKMGERAQLVRFLLIGDARLGVPFYRALNAGLKGGVIASNLLATPNNSDTHANKQFEQDMHQLATQEINRANASNKKVELGKSTSFFARFASHRLASDTMNPQIVQQLRDARITPLPFYKKHRSLITRILLLAALFLLLTLTGGLASMPIMAGMVATLTLTGANFLCSALLTTAASAAYEGITSGIRYFRAPPKVIIIPADMIADVEKQPEHEQILDTTPVITPEPVAADERSLMEFADCEHESINEEKSTSSEEKSDSSSVANNPFSFYSSNTLAEVNVNLERNIGVANDASQAVSYP